MHLLTLTATLLASSASAKLVQTWLNITHTVVNPDGLYPRQVVGVNGTWPPPPLDVTVGDTVEVTIINGLNEPTAMHHHGIYFNKTGYYDGAPGITQCGIPPGQSLTYTIPVDDQWGTYWYHSHVGAQYVDGLRAPFIIHNTKEVHQYDAEYTIIIGDWYHEQHSTLMSKFMNIYNPTGAEPIPDSALIYIASNGQYLPGFNENSTIPFEAGKTYRLRIINTSAFAMFYTWIDGHQMNVIEADGTDTDPYPVDTLSLSVAQRYSVLVTARNTTDQNFLFHANFDYSMFDVVPDALQLNYTSTVMYNTSAPTAPQTEQASLDMTMDNMLVPSTIEPQLNATRFISLSVAFETYDNGINRAAFNDITFRMPAVPSLFSALTTGNGSTDAVIYGPQTQAYILEKGEVVDLLVTNTDGNSHPFHLHGHKVQIVRVVTDYTSNDTMENPVQVENAPNPMRRDTVVVSGGGSMNMRFVADNPGAWIFHCHIEWHLESGLAVVFIEAPLAAQSTVIVPQVMKDQCAMMNMPYSGNAVGRIGEDLQGVVMGPYPQTFGWKPKGIIALTGSILIAFLGMFVTAWYSLMGEQMEEEDMEDEVKRKLEEKRLNGSKMHRVKKLFAKKNAAGQIVL